MFTSSERKIGPRARVKTMLNSLLFDSIYRSIDPLICSYAKTTRNNGFRVI